MSTEKKTVLAFDVETRLLASEVESEFAEKLRGESPWAKPELFGFAVGTAVNVETGVVFRFGPEEPMLSAREMAATLAGADQVVSYNGEAFDLGVLLEHEVDYRLEPGDGSALPEDEARRRWRKLFAAAERREAMPIAVER